MNREPNSGGVLVTVDGIMHARTVHQRGLGTSATLLKQHQPPVVEGDRGQQAFDIGR